MRSFSFVTAYHNMFFSGIRYETPIALSRQHLSYEGEYIVLFVRMTLFSRDNLCMDDNIFR
jgi:hypothetical protein